MNVLLLNPVTRTGMRSLRVGRCQGKVMVGFWPNIEHGYIAAVLRQRGIGVQLLDANAKGLTYAQMMSAVSSFAPDVVLLLSITATLQEDLAAGDHIRGLLPASRVIYWGTHATVRPEDYLRASGDLLIRREPEMAAVELCEFFRSEGLGALQIPETIPGVSYRDSSGVHHTPDRPFLTDLEAMSHPAHDLMGVGSYLATDIHRPFALIKTSRGCPNQCVFCTAQTFHGNRWRPRDVTSVLDEVQAIVKGYGIHDFFFQSDVFSKSSSWTAQLCQGLLDRGLKIRWFANSRVDCHDEATLALMKRSGCRLLAFGVESGSDTVLKAIKKGATCAQAVETLAACKKAGIPSLTYWVFGLPGETAETVRETLRFIKEVRPDYAHFYAPTPLPGSKLYETYGISEMVARGELDWGQFFQGVSRQFVTPEVSVEEVQRALRQAYLQFYSDPRRIARELGLALTDLRQFQGRLNTFTTMVRNYVFTD